jgi:hypothetical protein
MECTHGDGRCLCSTVAALVTVPYKDNEKYLVVWQCVSNSQTKNWTLLIFSSAPVVILRYPNLPEAVHRVNMLSATTASRPNYSAKHE